MYDLTKTGVANLGARRAEADAACADDPTGRVARLRDAARAAVFSTNVSVSKVLAYDELGEVVDTRRYYVHEAGDEATGLRLFEEAQRDYLAPRAAFEALWMHGERLIYGAVNIGGAGPVTGYGPFCLVTNDPEDPPPDALAVFPGDSVALFTAADGSVLSDAAVAAATAWEGRGDVVAVARAADVIAAPDEGPLSDAVCGDRAYHEAPRAGELPLSALSEVRIPRALVQELDELRARVFAGDAVGSVDENRVRAYDRARRWRTLHRVTITEVP